MVYNIKGKSGNASFSFDSDAFLGSKITLIPYYVDDDGKEIIGEPYKYYSGFLAKRLMN